MAQGTPICGSSALFVFVVTTLLGVQLPFGATEGFASTNDSAPETADCNVVYEWSTRLTFFENSRPQLALVGRAFSQLTTGMTRDAVASRMAGLGFDESATRLRYLFVDGVGDYRPHHRAELRFRDELLYSIRYPDSLGVPPLPDGLSDRSPLQLRPDIVETALTVSLNCKGPVSGEYQLAHMGAWHIACGMSREAVSWALQPIPVSSDVEKWVLVVRERPLVNLETHVIVFDGDAVGLVAHDHDNPRPWN
jgi:hypothetical protein